MSNDDRRALSDCIAIITDAGRALNVVVATTDDANQRWLWRLP